MRTLLAISVSILFLSSCSSKIDVVFRDPVIAGDKVSRFNPDVSETYINSSFFDEQASFTIRDTLLIVPTRFVLHLKDMFAFDKLTSIEFYDYAVTVEGSDSLTLLLSPKRGISLNVKKTDKVVVVKMDHRYLVNVSLRDNGRTFWRVFLMDFRKDKSIDVQRCNKVRINRRLRNYFEFEKMDEYTIQINRIKTNPARAFGRVRFYPKSTRWTRMEASSASQEEIHTKK